MIHSIDSPALLHEVDGAALAAGRRIDLLVQVDLAGEATKHGAREDDLRAIFDAARTARAARVVGLMLLPPYVEDPEAARPFFRALRDVRQRLIDGGVDPSMLGELSMGMSHDFEVAVEEGATIVRVGHRDFRGRPRPASPGVALGSDQGSIPGIRGRGQTPDLSADLLVPIRPTGERSRMNVSPLDLRQQRFRSSFRGFDKVEVTAFLAAVADDYEQALRETDRMRQEHAADGSNHQRAPRARAHLKTR